jgi:hypothetical protein
MWFVHEYVFGVGEWAYFCMNSYYNCNQLRGVLKKQMETISVFLSHPFFK